MALEQMRLLGLTALGQANSFNAKVILGTVRIGCDFTPLLRDDGQVCK